MWILLRTTSSLDDHRLNFSKCMKTWSRQHGIPINRSMYLSKETIDSIAKLQFNPAGVGATLTLAEKGISNPHRSTFPWAWRQEVYQQAPRAPPGPPTQLPPVFHNPSPMGWLSPYAGTVISLHHLHRHQLEEASSALSPTSHE